ncbi:PAAR domain-containing protein [Sodalis sp. RH15]|jgi:uncharacterized Zn-binding protein involved in type VI secretion|uniref:PAAR domain-containing protein n=1 Tax=Sodalis sp. RH15 TaxID=3394330 RepID=UPI0039B5F5E8
MTKGFVLLSDKTSHGGEVISASSSMLIDNEKVALKGDMISCPISDHGNNSIIEGSSEWFSDGKEIVVDGCRCECGCVVISSTPGVGLG